VTGLTGCRVDILPTVFAAEDVVDLFPLQVRPLDILHSGLQERVVSSLQAKGATGQGRTNPFLERELVRTGGTPPLVAARSFDQAELIRAIRTAVRCVYSRAAYNGSGVEQRVW
jgi:hypothetical protein